MTTLTLIAILVPDIAHPDTPRRGGVNLRVLEQHLKTSVPPRPSVPVVPPSNRRLCEPVSAETGGRFKPDSPRRDSSLGQQFPEKSHRNSDSHHLSLKPIICHVKLVQPLNRRTAFPHILMVRLSFNSVLSPVSFGPLDTVNS